MSEVSRHEVLKWLGRGALGAAGLVVWERYGGGAVPAFGATVKAAPAEANHAGESFGETYKIVQSECIACGACMKVCAANAITDKDGAYVIDKKACTACGKCVEECPIKGAIVKA